MRKLKKAVAYICAAAMLIGSAAMTPANSDAAKQVKLSNKKVTVRTGSTAKITLKNGSRKGKVTWKSSRTKVAKKQEKGGN